MLEDWANTIVILALGLGIGGTCSIMIHLTPQSFRDASHSSMREGEGLWEASRRRADEGAAIMETSRGARTAALSLYALVAVLVLTVWLSPVHLGWWTLLIAIAVGIGSTEGVFQLARAQKLRPSSGRSLLNPFG
jgi:membrane protein required for beta-lactamase induction